MRIINAESHIYSKELFDKFKILNPLSFFEDFQFLPIMSDRFGGFNKYSTFNLVSTKDINYLKTIKEYSYGNNIQQFLFDSVDKRGKEILDRAYNDVKHIYLLWSGGIDSTAVFVSLLKSIREDQKKMLHIVMSPRSIDEYKLFYERYVKDKFDILWTNKNNYEEVYRTAIKRGYTLTGDCGDQIYGSHITHTLPFWFNDYRDYLRKQIYPNQNIDSLIGQFETTFKEYGMDIQKVHDFVWWMNFSCKWDIVSNSVKHITKVSNGNEIAFFDYKDFEIYALNIPHDIHVSEFREYKKDMKKYIYDFTGDEEYYRTKMKIGSSKSNHKIITNAELSFLTENKKIISHDVNFIKSGDYFSAIIGITSIMNNVLKPEFQKEIEFN